MTGEKEPVKTFTFEYDLKVSECPCGSGKKPEKCCGPVKPRTHSLDLDPRNYYESDGLAIGLDYQLKRIVGGELKPLIGNPKFSHSYKRCKNNKVLVKGDSYGDYVMNPNSILLGFDKIFAIDTNTKHIDGHQVSVTAVIHAYIEDEADHKVLRYAPITLMEFWDAEVKPELLGWYATISALLQNDDLSGGRIGFVVDSELGDLESFNNGDVPIVDDFYLPTNYLFVYATSDRASSVANKLMKICDAYAKDKLTSIQEDIRKDSLKETTYPCRWFRQWVN